MALVRFFCTKNLVKFYLTENEDKAGSEREIDKGRERGGRATQCTKKGWHREKNFHQKKHIFAIFS